LNRTREALWAFQNEVLWALQRHPFLQDKICFNELKDRNQIVSHAEAPCFEVGLVEITKMAMMAYLIRVQKNNQFKLDYFAGRRDQY
jgi:hypothetical protein